METKHLYAVALVIVSISGGYYYFSGKGNKLQDGTAQNMSYVANDVKIRQTDEKGLVAVEASVQNAIQNQENGTTQLNNFHATTYSSGQTDTIYSAKQANGYDNNQKIILTGEVVAQKTTPQGMMNFSTDELIGYPKTKIVETDHVVHVDSAQSNFISKGLKADLNTGQYEFFNIRGNYAPKS